MLDILFINTTDDPQLKYETNGTMILATKLLEANFNVDVFRFYEINHSENYSEFIETTTKKILERNSKCISFYTLWPYYHILLRLAKRIKEENPNIIIVFGGPQSSATALDTMKAMNFVDYICTGEGEDIVVPFFETILRNNGDNIENIPGLYYRENNLIKFNNKEITLCNLNLIPHWDKRLLKQDNYTDNEKRDLPDYFMPIDAGRGCPYSCNFCCTSMFWKRTYRLKSAERIVNDIKYYNQEYGINSFWFSHDAFTTNRQLVSDVCDAIIEEKLNITWRCTARVDCLPQELILKMKQSGMVKIEVGIETGSKRMQKIINKNLNLDKAKETIRFLLNNGIETSAFFMYGFPEETEEDLNETLELMFTLLDMGVKHTTMSFCSFVPATEITNKYFNDLILDPDIQILSRNVFGYKEEFDMIRENKGIFTNYYHFNSKVRNEYQYANFLIKLYQRFPNSMRFLRSLFKNDNLKFYRHFINNNKMFFEKDILYINDNFQNNVLEIAQNSFNLFESPIAKKAKSLLEYDFDIQQVSVSREDIKIEKEYEFSFIEYKMKLPIENFSNTKTKILIEKKDGKINQQILSLT